MSQYKIALTLLGAVLFSSCASRDDHVKSWAAPNGPTGSSYFDTVQGVIAANIKYPPKARRNNQEGTCRVVVTFSRDGVIESVDLKIPTRFDALNAECRNVFGRIIKFPPVPTNVAPNKTDFTLELPITFNLK